MRENSEVVNFTGIGDTMGNDWGNNGTINGTSQMIIMGIHGTHLHTLHGFTVLPCFLHGDIMMVLV